MFGMKEKEIEEFKTLIDIFEEDAGRSLNNYISMGRLFCIDGQGEVDFMLRFQSVPLDSLTVARIEFKHRRRGNGTKLLKWLHRYGLENGYKKMVIESPITKEIHSFAKKHDFQLNINGNYEKNIISKG